MNHWDDLKYLLAVKEHGSLINAAKFLKTNPTTVSRHIKRLSDTYGLTLYNRTGNGDWKMTAMGDVFVLAAERCKKEIDGLSEPVVEQETQCIKISTVEFIADRFLAPAIGEFFNPECGLSVSLDVQDRNVSLAFGEADLAIRMARPTSGRLVASKVGDVAMSVFCPVGGDKLNWIGLTDEYDWVPEMKLGLEFFGRPPALRMGSFASVRRAALESGLSCVGPDKMMTEWPELKRVEDAKRSAYREVWSVFHESRRQDKALLAAREWAKSCFDFSAQSSGAINAPCRGAA